MSEFIQSLVKQQTTALVVVDTTKIVQFMNPAAELLLDISFKRAVLEPFFNSNWRQSSYGRCH